MSAEIGVSDLLARENESRCSLRAGVVGYKPRCKLAPGNIFYSAKMGLRLNIKSVIFHGIMALVYFVLIVIALVALGSFATKNADIQRNLNDMVSSSDSPCALYASRGGDISTSTLPMSGPERNCQFVLAGEVIVFVAAVVLLVVSVIKAIIGIEP